jgi:RNA polymerase sigma factor FliA
VQTEPTRPDANERSLWIACRAFANERARAQLVELYEPLARSMAARMYGSRVDDSVPFADYLQYARIGLMEAVDRYDIDREVPFAAYSSSRIRGAILNGIAKESEQAAQRRFWSERWHDRMDSLRTAIAPEADRASLAEVVTITMGLAVGVIVEGLDAEQEPADPHPRSDPYSVNELRQLGAIVRKLMDELPEKERLVITGHYVEQTEFQVLAQRLGVTKGRVSQIHAQALTRLREWLEKRPSLDRKL